MDPTTQGAPPPLPEDGDLTRSYELLRHAREGSREALDELLARYRERATRIARVRMGSSLRRLLDSEDVVQEAFLVAVRHLEDFEPRSHASLVHWLARIIENKLRDAARSARAQKQELARLVSLEDLAGSSEAFQLADGGLRPSQEVGRAELQEIYEECLQRLPEEEREAVLLRDYAGATWEELAERLARPSAPAARELYRRAQLRLGGLLRRRLGG